MAQTVRTAVIGVGHFGKFHAEKFARIAGSDLIAVADIDAQRAQEIAGTYGAQAVTDYRDLFGRVDAVSVAVPTNAHFDVALDCLNQGIHVLVEKPITDRIDRADQLIEAAARNDALLQVGHIERFSGVYASLTEHVTRPLYIESHRISPFLERGTDVNVILDVMIHDIDLILALVDAPVTSVSAIGAPVLSASEDIANARLEFANGCVATITASRVSLKTERKMRIFQPDCYITVDFKESTMARFTAAGTIGLSSLPKINRSEWSYPEADSLELEIAAFVQAAMENTPVQVDGVSGRDALQTAIMISDSLQAHRKLVEAAYKAD
jgi:predicted dehydrogenase